MISIAAITTGAAPAANGATYEPISGTGSTWTQDAVEQWRRDVAVSLGMTVAYSGVGSTAGRRDFMNGSVDFAVSEVPFQADPEDGSAPEIPSRGYAYVPLTAGGLAFMYHLVIDGRRVTDLRLSGPVVTKIFSGAITNWSDPAIQADNPGHVMPDKPITPVVRSDGSGTSAQLTAWMSAQYPSLWPHGARVHFPVPPNGKAQRGSDGVAGYVAQAYGEGAITYVENAYSLQAGFPAAKVLNAAGYYVPPTAGAVSIALLGAKVVNGVQELGGVYDHADPRAYPVSSYSYLIAPTEVGGIFTAPKGQTLGRFIEHAVCEGQQRADELGDAPLPLNLVREAAARVAEIPGAAPMSLDACANPTFVPGDTDASNRLLRQTPMPPAADYGHSGDGGLGVTVEVSGRFELVAPVTSVHFGELRRGTLSDVEQLGAFTVIDDRADLPGWTLELSVEDFRAVSGAAGTIPRSAVGFSPHGEQLPEGIAVGLAQAAGSSSFPAVIASGDAGSATGEAGAHFGLGLTFLALRSSPSGEFRSTLTLTLLSD